MINEVLVVEDQPEMNEIIGAYVTLSGYEYRPALTGGSALMEARRHPALILLDMMLPDLSGLEICRRLKADPESKDIPIVFLTARVDEQDERQARELGAADYMRKPFDPEQLLDCIRHHAALRGP